MQKIITVVHQKIIAMQNVIAVTHQKTIAVYKIIAMARQKMSNGSYMLFIHSDENMLVKIWHTQITKSLDVCKQQHGYLNKQKQTEKAPKKYIYIYKIKLCVVCHMSHVVCHMSNVWCHMSHVMCHLSLMTTATATDPPPSYYPIMQGRVVCKSPKSKKKFKPKTSLKQTN